MHSKLKSIHLLAATLMLVVTPFLTTCVPKEPDPPPVVIENHYHINVSGQGHFLEVGSGNTDIRVSNRSGMDEIRAEVE